MFSKKQIIITLILATLFLFLAGMGWGICIGKKMMWNEMEEWVHQYNLERYKIPKGWGEEK